MRMFGRWIAAVFLALCLSVSAVWAQEDIDFNEWTPLAERAEEVLSQGRASDSALEGLRLDVAGWRATFQEAQDANAARISTLQAQIDQLGAPPESGTEAPELAQRREELTAQMAVLSAPVQRAIEAYTRADGIISEIDTIIRERQTDALMTLGPSPLNPAHWVPAYRDITGSLRSLWTETRENMGSEATLAQTRGNLPVILFLLVAAAVLLIRGRRWSRWAVVAMRGRLGRGIIAWRFIVSLGQIVLPLAGIMALVAAILATGMVGTRLSPVLSQLPYLAAVYLVIRWLADHAFDADDTVAALPLAPDSRAEARGYANILSGLYIAKELIASITQFDNFDAASTAVVQFPILLLSGLTLMRLGRVRNAASLPGKREAAGVEETQFSLRMARLLGRIAMIVGVLGPVLAGIGYATVGNAMVYPAIETLALVGAVLVIQNFLSDLYYMLTGKPSDGEDALVPVLAGFVVTIAALPFLALIWGARVADLTEIWTKLREGFAIGETRISPTDFMIVVVVFVIGYMLTRVFQGALRSSVLPKTKIDVGGQNAIVSGTGYVGIFLAALIAISAGGLDLSSLALVAGALSVGVGFGLQNIVSNFVSGIILLIERPISHGDWIEVGGVHGTVKDISVRSTRIETFDRYDVIIPNADLVSGQVANYTKSNALGRLIVSVGVAYGTDTRRVEKLLLDIARQHDMVLMNPAPYVYFKGFGADSMDFEIRAILRDVSNSLSVRTEMNHEIAEIFAREGIEIPFAQRDIWIRNPDALPGGQESS